MQRVFHDIVISDFGRPGTIRYFKLFSDFERKVVTKLNPEVKFYDEMRRIRYTIVGALRQLKKDFLPEYDQDIDHKNLVGVQGGIEINEMIPQFFKLVLPYIKIAIKGKATDIRIVIPCNTLSHVADSLSKIFASAEAMHSYAKSNGLCSEELDWLRKNGSQCRITAPSVVSTVISKLSSQGITDLQILGSSSAILAYRNANIAMGAPINLSSYSEEAKQSFNTILQKFIEGSILIDSSFTDRMLLSACTDIELEGALDSLEIYVQELVNKAYSLHSQ